MKTLFNSLIMSMFCFSMGIATAQVPIPISNWKVEQPDARNASEVSADGITLRQYSNVWWESVNMEIEQISLNVRSLSNMPTNQNFDLRVYYDDGLIEIARMEFSGSNTVTSTVNTSLVMNKGRSVESLRLSHGRSGGRYHISDMSYTAAAPVAAFLDQSNLAGAKLNPGAGLHNNVLLVKGSFRIDDLPFLTQIPTGTMQLVASVTGFTSRSDQLASRTDEYSLTLLLDDRDGNRLRTIRIPLTLNVNTVEVDFSDIDPKLINRIRFMSNYSGIQFSVRQINFGPPKPTPTAGCPGLKTVNDRFQSKLDSWKTEGMMGRRYINELEDLLEAFRQLE